MSFFVIWLSEKTAPEKIVSTLAKLFNSEKQLIKNYLSSAPDTNVAFRRQRLGGHSGEIKSGLDLFIFSYQLCVFPHSDSAKKQFHNNLNFALAFSQESGLPLAISAESINPYQCLLIDKGEIFMVEEAENDDNEAIVIVKSEANLLSLKKIIQFWFEVSNHRTEGKAYLMFNDKWWVNLV